MHAQYWFPACIKFKQESCIQGRCVDVKHMMDTWTLQMGYPVIDVKHLHGNQYLVSQERFLYFTDTNVTSEYISPFEWVDAYTMWR